MQYFGSRTYLTWLALLLIVAIVDDVSPSAPAAQSLDTVPEQLSLRSVEDIHIVVRHRGTQGCHHTYGKFSPTQLRMEGNTIIIEGSAMESPVGKTVDFTINLQTTKPVAALPRRDAGHWWFDDEDRMNSRH